MIYTGRRDGERCKFYVGTHKLDVMREFCSSICVGEVCLQFTFLVLRRDTLAPT